MSHDGASTSDPVFNDAQTLNSLLAQVENFFEDETNMSQQQYDYLITLQNSIKNSFFHYSKTLAEKKKTEVKNSKAKICDLLFSYEAAKKSEDTVESDNLNICVSQLMVCNISLDNLLRVMKKDYNKLEDKLALIIAKNNAELAVLEDKCVWASKMLEIEKELARIAVEENT